MVPFARLFIAAYARGGKAKTLTIAHGAAELLGSDSCLLAEPAKGTMTQCPKGSHKLMGGDEVIATRRSKGYTLFVWTQRIVGQMTVFLYAVRAVCMFEANKQIILYAQESKFHFCNLLLKCRDFHSKVFQVQR